MKVDVSWTAFDSRPPPEQPFFWADAGMFFDGAGNSRRCSYRIMDQQHRELAFVLIQSDADVIERTAALHDIITLAELRFGGEE